MTGSLHVQVLHSLVGIWLDACNLRVMTCTGNMVDYLVKHKNADGEISITELWKVVIYGLQDIWPEGRTRIGGSNMGDVWELS